MRRLSTAADPASTSTATAPIKAVRRFGVAGAGGTGGGGGIEKRSAALFEFADIPVLGELVARRQHTRAPCRSSGSRPT